MAGRIILGTANPSLDGNGAPVAGSTLTFYQNHTTTLQSIYTAIDLMTPLVNPLTCDASGEFPQIWGPDSIPYSVKWVRPGEADVTFDDIYPSALANNNYFRLVDVVATTNIAVASGLANGQTIDGQVLATGMRVLLTAQTTGSENGIYDSPVSGAASRSADSNSTSSIPNGIQIVAQRGTVFKDSIWLHTTAVGFTLGVTSLTFDCIKAEGTFSLADASGGGLSYGTVTGSFTKNGKLVTAFASGTVPVNANGNALLLGGLPFTAANPAALAEFIGSISFGGGSGLPGAHTYYNSYVPKNTKNIGVRYNGGTTLLNSDASGYTFEIAISYMAA